MIFSIDNKTHKILATIQNGDTTEGYECSFLSCDNPVCTCGILYLIFDPLEHEGDNRQASSFKVDIDIIERKLDPKPKDKISEENLKFANLLFPQLDDTDFRLLWERYFSYKNKITEEAKINSIEAHFEYREVEQNGLMSAYNDVLPYGDQLLATINGTKCIIFDQYCLLPKCSCTNTILSFFSTEEVHKASEELFSVNLTYRKKKWGTLEGQNLSVTADTVRSAIEEQIPDIYKKLLNRHIKLKSIYSHCKKKHFSHQEPVHLPKVGRNAPCPCGSGKKYKQCCLGKSK